MRCPECGAAMHSCHDPFNESYKGVEVTVTDVDYLKCEQCGETAFDSATLNKIDDQVFQSYRRMEGLMSPQEIARLRKRLGLTQEQFQKLLGVGKTSVSRWETNRIPQSKLADNLMRAIECSSSVAEMLAEKSEVRIASENAAG